MTAYFEYVCRRDTDKPDALREYLEGRESGTARVMMKLYSDEEVLDMYGKARWWEAD